MRRQDDRKLHQQGVALAYLLWMLAGLSLLVGSVVTLSLTDVRATALQLDHARVRAMGTGVAHLLMRDMQSAQSQAVEEGAGGDNGRAVFTRQYRIDDYDIEGRVIPLNGLVSLNQAPVELLSELFHVAGSMPGGEASQLAERVLEWRSAGPSESQDEYLPAPFVVIEDLLRVPGMTRSVYDRVRRLVHTESGGSPGIDPLAAPAELLLVLAGGDAATVDVIVEARQDDSALSAPPSDGLNPDFMSSGGSSAYCLEVDVKMGDGRVLQQRVWADLRAQSRGAPWRFTRVQPVETIPSSREP